MAWKAIAVAIFDALILVLLYFIFQDLAWRTSYAESEGFTLHTTFLPLIRFPTITGNVQTPLASPAVLDWAQVLFILLVIVNVSYIFSAIKERRRNESEPANSG